MSGMIVNLPIFRASNLNKWRTKMKPEEAENFESAQQNVTIENDPEVQFTMWRYVDADCFHF